MRIPTAKSPALLSYQPTMQSPEQVSPMGRGIAALGGMVQEIGEKERVRADNESFLTAKTKYDAWNLDFETQAGQRQGEDTKGLVKEYQEAEQEQWDEIFSGLSPRAAQAFEQHRAGQVASKKKFHAFAEFQGQRVAAQNNFAGSLKVFDQKMQAAPYDIADHDAEAQQLYALGVSSGALLPSQKDSFMADYAGKKQSAWQKLFDLAPDEALKRTAEYGVSDGMKAVYVEKHKDKQATAQSITLANDLSSNGKSLKENLDYVHNKYANQPELHDKLVSRLKLRGAEESASVSVAKFEQKKQFTAQIQAVEVDPKNRGAASQQLASIIDAAPHELQKELTTQANEILNPSGLTDLEKMANVERAVLNKDITSLEELQTNYAGISRKDQLKLEKTLRNLTKGEVPKLTVDKVNRVLAELGYKKNLKSEKDMKKFNAVHAAYTAFFDERNPQSLKDEQETNIAFRKRMEQEGIIPDGGMLWGDKNLTRAEAIAADSITDFVPQVDEAHQQQLAITTKALGVDVKNKDALRLHNKAWLPVYESMDEADLQKVISVLQRKKIAVTPATVERIYKALAGNKG